MLWPTVRNNFQVQSPIRPERVVPSATVNIQGVGFTDTKTTQTDDKGGFEFMLPPGRYRIDIAATGFGPYEQDGINVDAAVPLRLNVVLQVEAHRETVEVNAGPQSWIFPRHKWARPWGRRKCWPFR